MDNQKKNAIFAQIFNFYIMKRRMSALGGLIVCLTLVLACPMQAVAQSSDDRKKGKVEDLHLDAQQYMEILGSAITTLQGQYVDTIDWGKALATGL